MTLFPLLRRSVQLESELWRESNGRGETLIAARSESRTETR